MYVRNGLPLCPKTISWPKLKLSMVGYPPTPAPSHRPSEEGDRLKVGMHSGTSMKTSSKGVLMRLAPVTRDPAD